MNESRHRGAEALAEIGRLLAQSLDVDVVARRIVESLRQMFGARYTALFRIDQTTGGLVPVIAAGELAERLNRDLVLPPGTGAAGIAVATRSPFSAPDVLADARVSLPPDGRALIAKAGYRAVLSVPLLVQDRVIGALSVGDTTGRAFPDDEVRLAEALADHAAIALENARLYSEIRASRDLMRTIAENSADAIVATDVHGHVTYLSPGAVAIFGYSADEILGKAAAPFYQGGLAEAHALMDRLRVAGKVQNYETAFRARNGRLTEVSLTVSLLRGASDEIVGTLGVLREVKDRRRAEAAVREREEAEAARSLLERLYSGALAMQSSWDLPARLEAFTRAARDVVGFDRFWVLLAAPDGSALEPVAGYGEHAQPRLPLSPEAGPFWDVYEGRRVVAVLAADDMTRLRPLASPYRDDPAFQTSRFVIAPLIAGDRAIGVVCADNKTTRRPISAASVEPFRLLCQQLATALEAARLYADAQARERESARLLEVAGALAASLDTDRVLDVITGKTVELLGCDASAICRYDPTRDGLTIVRGLHMDPELERAAFLRPGDGIAGRAFQERRPVWSKDAMAVPITGEARPYGVLLALYREPHDFSPREVQMVTAMADHAAVALANARLYWEAGAARDFLRSIASNSADTILTTDMRGHISYVSPGIEEMFGFEPASLLGQRVSELYGGGVEEARAVMARLVTGERIRNYETVLVARDGRRVDVSASLSLLRDADGNVLGTVAVVRDITDRKRADAELRRAKDAAEVANRAKSDFLASMSHEIRTPMNAIVGMADLLSETTLTAEQDEYVRIFRNAGQTLLTVINDILDLSKVEAGQIQFETIDFDLLEVVERTTEFLALRAHAKGLELSCRVMPDVATWVVGDPTRVRQVLVNLIGNAIKFTERGEVVLRVERDPDGAPDLLRFSVTDTGIGIAPDKLEQIFESFTQGDASVTRKFGGTGLGLTISRRFVELMGGRIWATSEADRGSTFYFTARLQPAPAPRVSNTGRSVNLAGVRTLVVDDNATNRLIVREALTAWGAQVTEAADGEQGLMALTRAKVVGAPYQLLLLDSRMPGWDGFKVAEAVRDAPALAGTTILMLTSDNRTGDVARCQELGVARYLVKPIKRTELFVAIGEALGRAAPAPVEVGARATPLTAPRPMRILLVEDMPENQALVKAFLKSMPWDLETAENGAIAVEKFTMDGPWHLVLMDMEMPVMDGYTATRVIREWERAKGLRPVPILALTAYALADELKKSLDAGCDAHLSKPVRKAALIEAITARAG